MNSSVNPNSSGIGEKISKITNKTKYPHFFQLSENERLEYALNNASIKDVVALEKQYEMDRSDRIVSDSGIKIYEGKDGNFYARIPDQLGKKKLIKKSTKRKIKAAILDAIDESKGLTVRQVFNLWNTERTTRGDIKPSTSTRYIEDADIYFKEFGERDIRKINTRQITKFLEDQVAAKDLSSKRFRNLKTLVIGTFKYARLEGYINIRVEDAIQDVNIPKNKFRKAKKKDSDEVFNQEEIIRITDWCKKHLDDPRALVLLMDICTGMRPGEVTTLKHSDFTYSKDDSGNKYLVVDVQRTATRYKNKEGIMTYGITETKTEAGERQVIIPTQFHWVYAKARLLNPDGEFFFMKDGKRINIRSIRRYLYIICDDLGIKKRSTNKIRKTYASILLDNNIDKNLIMKLMGHVDICITEENYHRNRKSYQDISDKLSEIPDFMTAFG